MSSRVPRKPSPSPSMSTATLKSHRRNKKNEQQRQSPRNPLQDLNAASSSASEASSISIESPSGCLRFLLSHSHAASSKMPLHNHSKTPKSLGPSKLSKSKENRNQCNLLKNSQKPISRKARKNNPSFSCLYQCQWHSGKKPRSTTAQQSKACLTLSSTGISANVLESGSAAKNLVNNAAGDVSQLKPKPSSNYQNYTPLNKIATAFRLDSTTEAEAEKPMEDDSNRGNSKTPPIQASVSPEIQCGSSAVSTTTPACYGAGHVVSGITDKRKCRPRGLLAVGDNDTGFGKGKALGSFDYADDDENVKGIFTSTSDTSLVPLPLPTEASMHWLSSPCREDNEGYKENAENGSCQSESLVLAGSSILHSPFSPSCSHELSSDVCNAAIATHYNRKNCSMNSPNELPEFREFLEPSSYHVPVLSSPHYTNYCKAEGSKLPSDLDGGENSPFSMDSLGSGNLIRTPESESSSDRYVDLLRLSRDNYKRNKLDSELNSVAEALQMTSLSPNSLGGPIRDSIDFSFQFDSLSTSCNSVCLTQFQRLLDDQACWNSCSTLGNESQSQSQSPMRISWREGLMSQMDEFDCCRCLSDEEEDAKGCNNDRLKSGANMSSNQSLTKSDCWSAKLLDKELEVEEEEGKENFPSCAESISTDGGGVLASGDSDWSLCYKNELFQV